MLTAIRSFPRLLAAVAVAGAILSGLAQAQSFPSRTVSMRVAYPAGGPADVAARWVQRQLQVALGQTVIVENLPGAAASIGTTNVLNAAPDGHTLLVTTGNDAILAPLSIVQISYKPESLRLLAVIYPADFVLVTNPSHSFTGLDDFLARARAAWQKELTVGSWGHGSAPYLVAADFSLATGARLLDVPYKGVAPVVQALLSQEIDAAFIPVAANTVEMIRIGRIKAIGVANSQRNPHLPDVPTLGEGKSQLKNFVYSAWAGVFVPTSVPEAVAAKLNKHLAEIVKTDDFQRFLKDSAALPVEPMGLAQAAAYYRSETDKFRRVAQSIKLQPQ